MENAPNPLRLFHISNLSPAASFPALRARASCSETWIDEFDYLYDKIGSGIFNVTMHPQVIGRGARMLLLQGLIEHIKDKPGVTFGTCAEYVAKWLVGKSPSLPADAAV